MSVIEYKFEQYKTLGPIIYKKEKYKLQVELLKLQEDVIKKNSHFKRMEYKDFLCIGHPRCGTTSISYYLKQMDYLMSKN